MEPNNKTNCPPTEDENCFVGTTNRQFQVHGMKGLTRVPLHPYHTKEDAVIHSKDFQDTTTDDEVESVSTTGDGGSFISTDEDLLNNKYLHPKKLGYPESDTRGRQYLDLTLERLSYLALENQRIRNYKLGRPLGQYISFTEPVPSLTNDKKRSWKKLPNPVHFELPPLIREVKLHRKFVGNSAAHHYNKEDLLENPGLRNDGFRNSELGRCGHFTSITRGFRNWYSCNRPRSSKSRLPQFICEEDIVGAQAAEGSRTWRKAATAIEKDRLFLESLSVWHLINLRPSNPNSLYYFSGRRRRLASEMGLLQNFTSVPTRQYSHRAPIYSDYIQSDFETKTDLDDDEDIANFNFIDDDPAITDFQTQSFEERPSFIDFRIYVGDNNNANKYSYNEVKFTSASHQFPQDEECSFEFNSPFDFTHSRDSVGEKRVTFAPETVFIERDMESPFWRDFTERRRRRQIMRQQRIRGNLRNRMSLFDLLKLHFRFPNKSNSPTVQVSEQSDEMEDCNQNTTTDSRSRSSHDKTASQSNSKSKCSKVTKFFTCTWCSRESS